MSAAGWKPEKNKIREILENVKSENDEVAFDEFVKLMTPTIKDQDESERYRVAFEMFDIENKGYITTKDLERVAGEIGENGMDLSDFEEMVKEAGNKERVSYEDFVKMMTFTTDSALY